MSLILVFDFTVKIIAGFFFLILSANFTTYMALMFVLRNQETPEGVNLKEKTRYYFIGMNCAYAGMIIAAFIPGSQPKCTSIELYPPIMLALNVIFLANTVFFKWLQRNNFFSGDQHEANWKSALLEKEVTQVQKDRDLFQAQVADYNKFLMRLTVIQFIIIFLAIRFFNEGEGLACTGNGN